MASSTTNIAEIQQNFMNNIVQEDQRNCISTTYDQSNNDVITINGANINGSFMGVSSTTSTDATCLIVSNMEDSVSNILQSMVQQRNRSETNWFDGFQVTDSTDLFNIKQSVTNNISRINESTCAANTIPSINNFVYVTNASNDFIGVTDESSASANCSMINTMKNVTYNQVQAAASQTNIMSGMFVAMVGAFAAIIGIMVIGVIILFAVGAIGYVGYDVENSTNQRRAKLSPEQNI